MGSLSGLLFFPMVLYLGCHVDALAGISRFHLKSFKRDSFDPFGRAEGGNFGDQFFLAAEEFRLFLLQGFCFITDLDHLVSLPDGKKSRKDHRDDK